MDSKAELVLPPAETYNIKSLLRGHRGKTPNSRQVVREQHERYQNPANPASGEGASS